MNKYSYTFILIFMLSINIISAQTEVIAHRGFWKSEGSAQNSITALDKAFDSGVYGSEFDVLMTKDGVLVVNHDDIFQGFDIQESMYKDIAELTLSNGETLPTLQEYLERGKELGELQLILELKPLKTKKAEDEAVEKIIAMVNKLEITGFVDYISFSLNICKQFKRFDPEAEVSYLNGDLSPKQIADSGLSGIDYHYSVLLEKHPEWIDEAHELDLSVNVWTVNDPEMMKILIKKGVDYITTDEPITLFDLYEKE